MTAVNISGTFKKDQRPFNGLEAIVDDLVDEGKQRGTYLIVAEVRPKGYKLDAEDGVRTPTVKFDHIEVAVADEDQKILRELLDRLYNTRTGNEVPATLPYDGEGWANDESKGKKSK